MTRFSVSMILESAYIEDINIMQKKLDTVTCCWEKFKFSMRFLLFVTFVYII